MKPDERVSAWAYPYIDVDTETGEVIDLVAQPHAGVSAVLILRFVTAALVCMISAALPPPLAILGFIVGFRLLYGTWRRYHELRKQRRGCRS